MKEWEDRLGGQQYHGGENPDEADFVVTKTFSAFNLFNMNFMNF